MAFPSILDLDLYDPILRRLYCPLMIDYCSFTVFNFLEIWIRLLFPVGYLRVYNDNNFIGQMWC